MKRRHTYDNEHFYLKTEEASYSETNVSRESRYSPT